MVASAVLAGMAISILPESALRNGMRVLSQADGFPPLPPVQIGLMKRPGAAASLTTALSNHIIASLDNISTVDAAPALDRDIKSLPRSQRMKSGPISASW